jgi:hypothetical protein
MSHENQGAGFDPGAAAHERQGRQEQPMNPMSEDDAVGIVNAYEGLLKRAESYLRGAPYWKFLQNVEFARFRFAGPPDSDDSYCQLNVDRPDEPAMRLEVTYAASDYGGYCNEVDSFWVPISVLTMSDEAFAAWKAEAAATYELRKRAETAAQYRAREAEERAVYEKLRAKYGD